MDSELQKAIDDYDAGLAAGGMVSENIEPDPIVEAARKVANPDIEAAAEVLDPYMVHPLEVMEATKAVVAAALGITEDAE